MKENSTIIHDQSLQYKQRILLRASVTRLAHLLKVFAANLLTKIAQIFFHFSGYFENYNFFGQHLWYIGLYFIVASGHTDYDDKRQLFARKVILSKTLDNFEKRDFSFSPFWPFLFRETASTDFEIFILRCFEVAMKYIRWLFVEPTVS